jgi:hypothetical protein
VNRPLLIALTLTFLLALALFSGCTKEKILQSEYIQEVEVITLPPDTIYVRDTTVTIQIQYDTVYVTDTVGGSGTGLGSPNKFLAVTALQFHNDPLVIDFINQEFGYTDGWIFYLSTYQLQLIKQSDQVYDIGGYIDYWAPDWSGYYPLEFVWRMTHTGGDPADPLTWTISEPPAAVGEKNPGMRLRTDVLFEQQAAMK